MVELLYLGAMLFNASERKGIIIILLLITGIFAIPKQFLTLDPHYYLIPEMTGPVSDSFFYPGDTLHKHSVFYPQNRKTVRTIELNSVDSVELVKVRGIGPYYARKIIRYRERLGGYYSVKQLNELKMTYFKIDSCGYTFTVNPQFIHQQKLDTMSFKALLRHPYLEYEDVQLIFNAKRQYDTLSYQLLEDHKVLTSYKLKKIKPYFK